MYIVPLKQSAANTQGQVEQSLKGNIDTLERELDLSKVRPSGPSSFPSVPPLTDVLYHTLQAANMARAEEENALKGKISELEKALQTTKVRHRYVLYHSSYMILTGLLLQEDSDAQANELRRKIKDLAAAFQVGHPLSN